MFEELFEPVPDVEEYLARIGYDGSRKVCRETLDGVISAHLLSVPFENLDVYDGNATVSLAVADLFDKIVTRRRGGFCFELNSSFMGLLRTMGFKCHAVGGRVGWGRDYRAMLGHRATVIEVDGRRLFCDVGFGGPVSDHALDLEDGAVQLASNGDAFRFTHENGETTLNRVLPKGLERLLTFSEEPFDERDFIPLCFYYAKSPASYFASKRMVNLRTRVGSVSIDGPVLRVHSGEGTEETPLLSPACVTDALREHFGINYTIERA